MLGEDIGRVIAVQKCYELNNLINSANYSIEQAEKEKNDSKKFYLYRYAILDYNACYDLVKQIIFFAFDFFELPQEPITPKVYWNWISKDCRDDESKSRRDNKGKGHRNNKSKFSKDIERICNINASANSFFEEYDEFQNKVQNEEYGIRDWANNIKHQGGFINQELHNKRAAIMILDKNHEEIFSTEHIFPFTPTLLEIKNRLIKQNEVIVEYSIKLVDYIFEGCNEFPNGKEKKFSVYPTNLKDVSIIFPYNINE